MCKSETLHLSKILYQIEVCAQAVVQLLEPNEEECRSRTGVEGVLDAEGVTACDQGCRHRVEQNLLKYTEGRACAYSRQAREALPTGT